MNYLSVENLTKRYADKVLFQDISFGLDDGQKIALVAKNGTGKTSLLNCLAGVDMPDSGNIVTGNGITVGYLKQNEDFSQFETVLDAVFADEKELLSLFKEYDLLLEKEEHIKAQSIFEQIEAIHGWESQNQARQILSKLNLSDLNQKISILSGGQKRRLALAKVLISNPHFLILDEPTNHLDLGMIEWLESYLSRPSVTLFMVTHDRYFLERICTDIYELDRGNLYKYQGNFSYYLEKRAERYKIEQTTIDKAKNLYKKELDWMRRQPKARGTKAKARIENFYDVKKTAHKNISEDELSINVKMERMGSKILEFHKVSKAYGDKIILKDFNYVFKKGEKLGLVGDNGAGKSTILKLITQNLEPDSGKIVTGETIVYGYYEQDGLKFKPEKRVIDIIRDVAEFLPLAGGKKLTAVQLLSRFLFPTEMHYMLVSKLSGGERKRLYLLKILMANPNFLILDEPTNDFDIYTLQVLEEYISQFQGCVIIVSHDRFFLDKSTDHLLVLNGDGSVKDIYGNYADYKKQKSLAQNSEKKAQKNEENKPKQKEKKRLSFNEQYEFEQLDKEIPTLESKKEELSKKLLNPDLAYEEIEEISNALKTLVEDIDEKSMRWMELAEYADQ